MWSPTADLVKENIKEDKIAVVYAVISVMFYINEKRHVLEVSQSQFNLGFA